jgi:hypothetical protein
MIRTYHFRDTKSGQEFAVEVDLDLDAIAKKLAGRAFRSKVGTATAMDSNIKCKVIKDNK